MSYAPNRTVRLIWLPLLAAVGVALGAEQGQEPGKDEPKEPTAKGALPAAKDGAASKKDAASGKKAGGGPGKAPGEEPKKEPVDEAAQLEAYKKRIEAGRAAFAKKNYAEALVHFREATVLLPKNHYASLLAGVAAYWNREPHAALEFWTPVAAEAQRNSPEEWEITRHLVLGWHALNEDGRAEEAVKRLYDLRSNVRIPQALGVNGFTRQHLWLGTRRLGVWEVFDERGEQTRVLEFHLVETKDGEDQDLARLALEVEPSPDGKSGYALVEDGGKKRIYKRWPARPSYPEARAAALEVIKGQLKFLDAGMPAADETPTKSKPDPKAAPPVPPTKMAGNRETGDGVKARLEKMALLKLSPGAARILAMVARLADVDFDVARFSRLSMTDPAAARKFEAEGLTGRYPHATEDASDLVQFVSTAKPAEFIEAFRNIDTVLADAKGDYARFVLLTALNTRGGDAPAEFLVACLGSADLVVRETAALLLGRGGRKEGVEALFKEIAAVNDPKSAEDVARIVSFPLEELLGSVLGACPARDTGAWREAALAWWKQNGPSLGFVKGAPAGQPLWRPAKQP